jgi:hypothetical protein
LSFAFLSLFVCRKIFWKLIVEEISNA